MSGACARPIADAAFLGWWAADLAPGEGRRLEEHLLACDACAARLRAASAIAGGVRTLVRQGRVPTVLTSAALERLRLEGQKLREYRVAAGAGVACTVAPDDDILVARLEVPPVHAPRMDLVSRMDDGQEERLKDLPFDASAPELILAMPIDVVRRLPPTVLVLRLIAVRPDGEAQLGEYTFRHTPWPSPRQDV